MTIYDPANSLGALPPDQIAQYLADIGDIEGAKAFTSGAVAGQSFPFSSPSPFAQTGMVIGFIPPGNEKLRDVSGLSDVHADPQLIGKRIKITFDKFHVASYPGIGTHSILCEFSGKNQVAGETEELTFARRFEARDNSGPSIAGTPIFMGINVGQDGISFKGRTVNVKSNLDEVILATLDTPAFKSGLALLNTAQPALKPLTSLAAAAVDMTLKRRNNIQVHCFDMGLDFSQGSTSARLRHGSYVVVQTDDGAAWGWDHYVWNSDGHVLQHRSEPSKKLGFNYMVFGVAAFSDASSA
ncbi:hypothetical protein [Chitinimonas sp. JJ19]|uniref:hypothetical protein n=1 Tax=Chitinimonas sp. JJ19 TaxID=3109352 RepID=UPI00300151D7